MPVRFIDTGILDEDWYVSLCCEMQHLWNYITLKCDHAGIWKPNKSGFEMRAKAKVNLDSFLQKVNGDKERIFRLKDGNWFLTGFIQFQWFNGKKNGFDLVLSNRLHASIFKSIEKHEVPLEKIRGLGEVLETSKVKVKEIISNTNPDIGGGKGGTQELTLKKSRKPLPVPTEAEFLAYCELQLRDRYLPLKSALQIKYAAWKEADWHDGNDSKINNWKTKILHVASYLKPDNSQAVMNQVKMPKYEKLG